MQQTTYLAQRYCHEATREISKLRPSPEREALIQLTEMVLMRDKWENSFHSFWQLLTRLCLHFLQVICFQRRLPKIIFLRNFWGFFGGGWEEFYFLFLKDKNKKMEVFYCRKPHSSEQIRSCCTIVLVGAINCGVGEDVYMLMHKGHNENKYKLVYENWICSKFHSFTTIKRACMLLSVKHLWKHRWFECFPGC